MQRHQIGSATLRTAYCPANTHGIAIPPGSGLVFTSSHRRDIVGIDPFQIVDVGLCHQSAVHPILHQIVDVPPHLLAVLLELRVLLQGTPCPLLTHIRCDVEGKYRLVLDGVCAVDIAQQPHFLTCQLRHIGIKTLGHPGQLRFRIGTQLRVIGVELVQRRRCLQHCRLLVLRQAHAVDVVKVEQVHLECTVIILALGPDGREYAVQALTHLLGIHVGLGVRNHADAR